MGRGKIGYLPAMEFDGDLPPDQPYFPIGSEFWKRPKNWKDLVDLVYWAAGDEVPIRFKGPRGFVINYTGQTSKKRTFIHVVNYDQANKAAGMPIEIGFLLPQNREPIKVTACTPGQKETQVVEFSKDGSTTHFTISNVRTYCLVTIEW